MRDFKGGHPQAVYSSRGKRSLIGTPPIRRDLIKRHLYLVPNSIVVSRGCPHHCDFCYKDAFYQDGRAFYTQAVDEALAEIERLPGRHLFFLDDHLFGNALFAQDLFEGMKGMNRLWQGAGTVQSILQSGLLEKSRRIRDYAVCSLVLKLSMLRICAPSINIIILTVIIQRRSLAYKALAL